MVRRFLTVFTFSVLSWACIEDNPNYCNNDEACSERDPSLPYCHKLGKFCYAGCQSDADCAKFEATPLCDTSAHHCKSTLEEDDGGIQDASVGGDATSGETCKRNADCRSGFCVRGVCCPKDCGKCYGCLTGSCKPLSGVSCDPPTCTGGKLTESTCNNRQECVPVITSCGGYGCGDAECQDKCDTQRPCLEGYECIDNGICQAQLPNGDECGENEHACESRKCVDGVCCNETSCADCFRCDGDTKQERGICTARGEGPAPDGQCPGDSADCGAGKCGEDGCAYVLPGADCGTSRCEVKGAGFESVVAHCDGAGNCVEQRTDCGFNQCKGELCVDGCLTHDDCIGSDKSLCDRSTAHAHFQGRGFCVDPDKVTLISSNNLTQTIINNAASGDYLKLAMGKYEETITIDNKQLQIVGATGNAADVKIAPSASVVTLQVENGGSLLLQHIQVSGTSDNVKAISCDGTSSTLVLLDSIVTANNGIGISTNNCTVELRRNNLFLNDGPAAKLDGGKQTLVNNLVTKNASAGGQIGALELAPSSAFLFVNNTIAGNYGSSSGSAISCTPNLQLVNSIVWDNDGAQHSGCNFTYSNVSGGAPDGENNISDDPMFIGDTFTIPATSPSAGKGNSSAPGVSTIDNNGKVRTGAIDQGAFES